MVKRSHWITALAVVVIHHCALPGVGQVHRHVAAAATDSPRLTDPVPGLQQGQGSAGNDATISAEPPFLTDVGCEAAVVVTSPEMDDSRIPGPNDALAGPVVGRDHTSSCSHHGLGGHDAADPCGRSDGATAQGRSRATLAIAIIDHQDGYTLTKGLGGLLTDLEQTYTDITADVTAGTALELSGYNVLIIGSFCSQSAAIRTALNNAASTLNAFVLNGGTVIMFTQADQDRAAESWVEAPSVVARGDADFDTVYRVQPAHALFTSPNLISNMDLRGWRYGAGGSWVTSWESLSTFTGAGILAGNRATNVSDATIVETGWGAGRALFLSMAVDKARNIGNSLATMQAPRLMQNLLQYAQSVAEGAAAPIDVDAGHSVYTGMMVGRVFEDLNEDGVYTAGEPGIAGVGVSDTMSVVYTDTNGIYQLANPGYQARLVHICLPAGYSKWAPWYRTLDNASVGSDFDFALTASDESGDFEFVQLSDTHQANFNTKSALLDAVARIGDLVNPPELLFATGDLVENGGVAMQYGDYVDIVAASPVPMFSVFGNHDGSVSTYRNYLGPDYYSLEYGNCHFLILNPVLPSAQQNAWVAQDLAGLAPDKQLYVFQHYPPTEAEHSRYAGYGAKAVFSGHWHSQRTVQYGDMTSYNTPPLTMGGIDCSPAGFKIVTVHNDELSTRMRWIADGKRLQIVTPTDNQRIAHDDLTIMVNAYETSAENISALYEIRQAGELVTSGALVKRGDWTWRGTVHGALLPVGTYALSVDVTNERQEINSVAGSFTIMDVPRPSIHATAPWRQFGGGATRLGTTSASVRPPLGLVWAAYTGGVLDFSSPVVDGNDLYIGVKDRGDFAGNGVMSIDIRSGNINWFTPTPAAVSHSVAIGDNLVYACSHGGMLHALDRVTGAVQWERVLGSATQRWQYGAPLLDGGFVYAGTYGHFGQYDALTGAIGWERVFHDDWISCNASPTTDGDSVIVGANWATFSVRSVSALTGATRWMYLMSGMHGSPVIADDRVVFTSSDAKLYCLRLSDGFRLWGRALLGRSSCTTAAVSASTNTVVCGSAGTIEAYRLDNGSPRWTFTVGASPLRMSPYDLGHTALIGSPTIVDDVVYVPCGDGRLYVLRLDTGAEIWSMNFGVPIVSAVCATGQYLYVSTYDGHVYAFAGDGSFHGVRDINGDGVLDLADMAKLVDCMGGPMQTGPGCGATEFARADVTEDGHVDLWDFAEFQLMFVTP